MGSVKSFREFINDVLNESYDSPDVYRNSILFENELKERGLSFLMCLTS